MRRLIATASFLALAACGLNGTDSAKDEGEIAAGMPTQSNNLADDMASRDPAIGEISQDDMPDSEERPIMQAQVVLDRRGFGPGVIDGKMGLSTNNALRGFQEANGLKITGKMDDSTKAKLAQWSNIPATRVVTIPQNWASLKFEQVPDGAAEQAKLDQLGYNTLDEKLAERFHTTVDVLKMLNPVGKPAGLKDVPDTGSTTGKPLTESHFDQNASDVGEAVFTAGQMIRVPNIGADRIVPGATDREGWSRTLASLGVGNEQPEVKKIVVSKSAGTLKAYDANKKLVALFTVTTGSENDPLPLGTWEVNGVAHNPPFAYNPELFWDVADDVEKQQLPPGPNGPVGVVWIDLTKEHYGIHGTPEPQTIGRAQSHGCVRLTNWDAARLAGMVSPGTIVLFEA